MRQRAAPRAPRTPTLGDIASAAGVSTATVSRVLNSPESVRPVLRSRVQKEIDASGYVADGAARALASRRSRTVGAVIPTLASAIFAEGMDAFEARLGDDGHSLVLAQSGYDAAQEVVHVRNLLERGVDAMMLVGKDHDQAVFDLLAARRVPHVETWTYVEDGSLPCAGFDNRRAAYRMASHVLDLGHRKIAMIAGISTGNDRATERIEGTRDALQERGARLEAARVLERPYDIAAGRQALRELMGHSSPPTAVICGNDVLATGAVLECAAAGIAVPGRLSITGFDDLPLAAHLTPPLTTMRVPSGEMGRRAAEYLLACLDGAEPPPLPELSVELIVRGTTGPVPDEAD